MKEDRYGKYIIDKPANLNREELMQVISINELKNTIQRLGLKLQIANNQKIYLTSDTKEFLDYDFQDKEYKKMQSRGKTLNFNQVEQVMRIENLQYIEQQVRQIITNASKQKNQMSKKYEERGIE